MSQERNVGGHGLDVQEDDVRRYAESRQWELVELYREEGVSGYKRDRPELKRMLADADAGRFDVAVFPSIDRIARSVWDTIDIEKQLRDRGVSVVFVREGTDTATPVGEFFRNVMASIAEFEGHLMRERMRKGLRAKAAKGGWTGTWLPYGYKGADGRAVIVKKEAAVVSGALLSGLNDGNADVRAGVARAIGDMWPNTEATVPLIGLLDDANVEVRRAAIFALGCIWSIDDDPRTVDPLVNALGDDDAESSPRVLAALLDALGDASADVRASAAGALGKSGNSQAVDPLIQRLRDESEHVRICVASALKRITGQNLGADHAKWDRWRREQHR